MARKKTSARNEESESAGGGKSEKKLLIIDDDEYSIGSDLSEEAVMAAPSGKKKKGKKGGSKKNENDEDLGEVVVAEEEEAPAIQFGGKKKQKAKKSGFSALGLLGDDDVENTEKVDDKLGVSSAFELLDMDESSKEEDEDVGIAFTGKKKKKKALKDSKKASFGSALPEEEKENNEEEDLDVEFSGKNKSSKTSDIIYPDQHGGDSADKKDTGGEATSKSKRKKKKGGKNGEESEDDFDKLLAEFGATPSGEKLQNQNEQEVQNQIEQQEADEEAVNSKKKKKKKKEKKATTSAAEETKNEINNKETVKKVPKHIREMQEKLAKVREAEERKKREEEERLRKEEEERLKQEELERLAEEKKRLKKEREKEKLLKKKQEEGKLLTGKQKEEARRLEAMRKQILANALMDISTVESSAKRPLYQKKKSKPQNQSNETATEDVYSKETQQEAELDLSVAVEDKGVDEEERQEEEDEDDDEEWDAKSLDFKLPTKSAFSFKLPTKSAFSDDEEEEVDSEPQPLPKKDIKNKTEVAEMHETKPKVDVKSDDQSGQNLRSPICCIMGHVDTGKTKLLDCIRGTNVQEGEAGGITQQIGATYIPAENIRDRTKELKADAKLSVPGLLVIDTPGHESFTNLRSRGSGLCDLAVLVVDIMHGLEPQTIESLNLLKMRNTHFIIALNKVDRLYGWKTCRNAPIGRAIKQQSKDVMIEFNMRLTQIITQFKEQGLNTEFYYKNKEMGKTYNIVPTSAISGEGVPNLLLLLVQWAQKTMVKRLTYSKEVQCTVLEVKVVEGHGTTIDVILVNGVLREGDQIVVCGMTNPIDTTIRALLTPHPMRELCVKGTYLHHKEIKAAQSIKIAAQGLESAIAGTSLYVVGPHDDLKGIKEAAMNDVNSVMSRIDKSGEGVCVQASTIGSLEALLEFLKTPAVNIPVSVISIGPVHPKDVKKASAMLDKKKEYGTILAFDVAVTPEAREIAKKHGVKIFTADIIYHLFDQFTAYIDNIKEEKKKEAAEEAVFPCLLRIIPNCVFYNKAPIVLGVDVIEGIAKIGTPLCVPQKGFVDIGRIASIEINRKPVDYAKKGQKVAIKIIGSNPEEQQKMFGRHFETEDELVSKISRRSLDALKENFADELCKEDIRLLSRLKSVFQIP